MHIFSLGFLQKNFAEKSFSHFETFFVDEDDENEALRFYGVCWSVPSSLHHTDHDAENHLQGTPGSGRNVLRDRLRRQQLSNVAILCHVLQMQRFRRNIWREGTQPLTSISIFQEVTDVGNGKRKGTNMKTSVRLLGVRVIICCPETKCGTCQRCCQNKKASIYIASQQERRQTLNSQKNMHYVTGVNAYCIILNFDLEKTETVAYQRILQRSSRHGATSNTAQRVQPTEAHLGNLEKTVSPNLTHTPCLGVWSISQGRAGMHNTLC